MNTAYLIHNAHRARGGGVVGLRRARELAIVAAQDGIVDADERLVLAGIPMDGAARQYRDRFLASSGSNGLAVNPEVEAWRRHDPAFDAKVAAVREYARPGDLILWRSDQEGFPWNLMKRAYGPFQHVCVVLGDGKVLDPYWPDGVTVSTVESAVAKSFHRIKASEMVIVRPAGKLSLEQVEKLTGRAYALQGKAYALVSPLDRPGDAMSCARAAWEVFLAAGIDLAPVDRRMYPIVISPGDFARDPVATILADGRVGPADKASLAARLESMAGRPRTMLAAILGGACWLGERFPALIKGAQKVQEPVTRWIMDAMAARSALLYADEPAGRAGTHDRPIGGFLHAGART